MIVTLHDSNAHHEPLGELEGHDAVVVRMQDQHGDADARQTLLGVHADVQRDQRRVHAQREERHRAERLQGANGMAMGGRSTVTLISQSSHSDPQNSETSTDQRERMVIDHLGHRVERRLEDEPARAGGHLQTLAQLDGQRADAAVNNSKSNKSNNARRSQRMSPDVDGVCAGGDHRPLEHGHHVARAVHLARRAR